ENDAMRRPDKSNRRQWIEVIGLSLARGSASPKRHDQRRRLRCRGAERPGRDRKPTGYYVMTSCVSRSVAGPESKSSFFCAQRATCLARARYWILQDDIWSFAFGLSVVKFGVLEVSVQDVPAKLSFW